MSVISNTITPWDNIETNTSKPNIGGFDINSDYVSSTDSTFKFKNKTEPQSNDNIIHFTTDGFITLNGQEYGTGGGFYYLNPIYKKVTGEDLKTSGQAEQFMLEHFDDTKLIAVYYTCYTNNEQQIGFIHNIFKGNSSLQELSLGDAKYARTVSRDSNGNISNSGWSKVNNFNKLEYNNTLGKISAKYNDNEFASTVIDDIQTYTYSVYNNGITCKGLINSKFAFNFASKDQFPLTFIDGVETIADSNVKVYDGSALRVSEFYVIFNGSPSTSYPVVFKIKYNGVTTYYKIDNNIFNALPFYIKQHWLDYYQAPSQYLSYINNRIFFDGSNLYKGIYNSDKCTLEPLRTYIISNSTIKNIISNDSDLWNNKVYNKVYTKSEVNTYIGDTESIKNHKDLFTYISDVNNAFEQHIHDNLYYRTYEVDDKFVTKSELVAQSYVKSSTLNNYTLTTAYNNLYRTVLNLGLAYNNLYSYVNVLKNQYIDNNKKDISYIKNWILGLHYENDSTPAPITPAPSTPAPSTSSTTAAPPSSTKSCKLYVRESGTISPIVYCLNNTNNPYNDLSNDIETTIHFKLYDYYSGKKIIEDQSYSGPLFPIDLSLYKNNNYGFYGIAYVGIRCSFVKEHYNTTLSYILKSNWCADKNIFVSYLTDNDEYTFNNEINYPWQLMNGPKLNTRFALGGYNIPGNGGYPTDGKSWQMLLGSNIWKTTEKVTESAYLYQTFSYITLNTTYETTGNVQLTQLDLDDTEKLQYGVIYNKYKLFVDKNTRVTYLNLWANSEYETLRADLIYTTDQILDFDTNSKIPYIADK